MIGRNNTREPKPRRQRRCRQNVHTRKSLAAECFRIMVGSTCYAVQASTLNAASPTAVHVHQAAKAAIGASQPVPSAVFNNHQMKTIAALSENIIPTDSHSPGAKAARVDEFVNETVSASGQAIQNLWVDGLAAVDKMAEREFGKSFADCSADQQIKLLTRISQNEEKPVTLEERFFVALKQSTVRWVLSFGYWDPPGTPIPRE